MVNACLISTCQPELPDSNMSEFEDATERISFWFQDQLMAAAHSNNICWAGKKNLLLAIVLLTGTVGFLACNSGDSTGPKQPLPGMAEGEVQPGTMAIAEPVAPVALAGQQFQYNFDSDSQDQPPAKFHVARTGAGKESRWLVMNDATAPSRRNVVAQTSVDQTDYRFPLLIEDDASFRDLELTVKFKSVSG